MCPQAPRQPAKVGGRGGHGAGPGRWPARQAASHPTEHRGDVLGRPSRASHRWSVAAVCEIPTARTLPFPGGRWLLAPTRSPANCARPSCLFGGSSVLCVASPPPKDPRICPGPSVWLRCAPLRACSLPRLGRGGHRGWTSDQSPLGFPNLPFNLLSWALEQSSPPP